MDLAIITARNNQQKGFWEKRLKITFPETRFIVVVEDWPGGAGNGLGTLYAIIKANDTFQSEYHEDLFKWVEKGHSAALFHCAGEGQRLYPLSASEHNNKAALKLPGLISVGPREEPITLLEAILKQTDPFVKGNAGRLSVFWGDQLFFPSIKPVFSQRHPLEIYVKEAPFPSSSEWAERHLENYGIVCFDTDGEGHLLEKCSYSYMQDLIRNGLAVSDKGLQISFGSFSISLPLLQALLKEFSPELKSKQGKLDTDAHFWMPLTLPLPIYKQMMVNKGMESHQAENHFQRMQSVRKGFKDIFGTLNLGQACGWWDFGNVKAYMGNLLKMLDDTEESDRMRKFLKMPPNGILNSTLKKAHVVRSIVMGTTANELEVEDSVIIGCYMNKITCKNSLFYNVHEDSILENQHETVRADINGKKFYSTLSADPKKQWREKLPSNPMSWEELHNHLSK